MIADSNREAAERRETWREETALRRIATLVAEGAQPHELFAAVAAEVGRVVDAPSVAVGRYEPDDTVMVCGTFPPQEPLFRTGTRIPLEGANVLRLVLEHAEPARVDDYAELRGEIADAIRRSGLRSSVGVPIVVAGRVWGAIVASNTERLPENTGARLAEFTALVAAAIANTEAVETLAQLADEQAALRRVATLVARNAAPAEIFAAVSAEVDHVFRLDPATFDVAVIGRFDPGPQLVVVGVSKNVEAVRVGSRWPPDDLFAPTHVLHTGRSARVGEDDLASIGGEVADFLRQHGYLSQVASPIAVDGRLWGAMSVNSSGDLPFDTEQRLERFTELVATAIANAESRGTRAQLADEQAALRRVATLVAEGVAPARIFSAVCEEVGLLLGADITAMEIFQGDEASTVIAVWSANDPTVPVGTKLPLAPATIAARILETRSPARRDNYALLDGEIGELARTLQLQSTVGAPILVDGELWGALMAATRRREPWAEQAETRLAAFTELIATAIANTETRAEVEQLADEQAALRRVATLVAKEDLPDGVFARVAEETGRLFGGVECTLLRHERDGAATNVGAWGEEISAVFPLGTRFRPDGDGVAATVLRTGQPHRIDDYSAVVDPVARSARDRGIESSVGCPIVVRGAIWGAIVVGTTEAEPFPPETEQRLTQFADLVATAVANAEARGEIVRLADEQVALRRVATLVAEGVAPAQIFEGVCEQVGRLLEADITALEIFPGDGTATLSAAWSREGLSVPVGRQLPLEPDTIAARIVSTCAPARRDSDNMANVKVGPFARDLPLESTVGAPILVGGRLWGALMAGTRRRDPWADEAETRLSEFAELIATAIANTESRDELAQLADEQAGLRRVATLVARDAPPGEVFDVVAMEVGRLLDTDITVVGRYDADGAATAIGSWSAAPGGVPVGTRSILGGRNVLTLVAETEQPARLDGYEDDASGEAAEIARRHGWRSSIAAPIIVEDRLWGVMLVATQRPEPFPAAAEKRLAAFTDLVATALANAQAHDELRRFGEEQAALGRVATLVAAGSAPEQVFTAVVQEASILLGLERIELVHYDGDVSGTVFAASGEHPFPAGTTWSLGDPSVMATVARTRRAARVDDYTGLEGEIAEAARGAGFHSAIGAPITVEGRLWGVIIAISTDPEPIPEQSEARLGQFTELVATAVANAEARQALERVAAEQATLRRIATLVARGVRPSELFAAVAGETATTFDAITAVMRFEHDPPGVTLVGVSNETGLTVGTRWDFVDEMASAEVYRTGRSARLNSRADFWSTRSGPVAEAGQRLGIVSQVSCPIVVEGGVWGVITVNAVEELPPDTEQRLEKFTDLVTTAIANAQGKSELAASRRRIVAAADEARRRIERDLHDGIQQRLIALSFRARAMTRRPPGELPDIAAELSEGLKDVSDELREVSRGIHPTILTEAGLGPALRALARRSDVPVDVDVKLDERLPPPVEAAAYYIASEALTNVAKHAQANVVQLIAAHGDGNLTLEVRDDGIGGVDAGRGSGILGLTDRVEALGGTISINSSPREGTTLSVRLPITT